MKSTARTPDQLQAAQFADHQVRLLKLANYEAAYRDRVVKQLYRRAANFGFRLEAIDRVS